MLDARPISFVADPPAKLALGALVCGKPREEVADLMPRLFNLCRAAQSLAVRMALGLGGETDMAALRREIIRDHVLRLAVVLPGRFGQAPVSLPAGWQSGEAGLGPALFGPAGRLPDTPEDFDTYLASGAGLAGLWGRIAAIFGPGEATTPDLPFVSAATATDPAATVENSCALRVASHPVVADLARRGRGPFWRVVARAYDLQRLLDGGSLDPASPAPGTAIVPATRGLYAVTARHEGDTVSALERVTPTDHLRAPGGVLDGSLATLRPDRGALVPLLMDILDPCTPVRVREVANA